jgi:HK97 family phage prohead protease
MTDVNEAGRAYARSLIAAGKIDRNSGWDFSAEDGNALLGGENNWSDYGRAHLGVHPDADPKSKGRFGYPVVKAGKVYRAGVIAAKQRAAAEGDSAIAAAAAELLDKIDVGVDGKGAAAGFECKITAFEFKFAEENGTAPGSFEGYGSVFGNEDDGGDIVMPGAFDVTLAQARAKGRMPKMLLNHGGLGSKAMMPTATDLLPIGKWKALQPDSTGLATKGQLINLDTESGKRIYGAMKEGELADLSMGYVAKDVTRGVKSSDPKRKLNRVDLHEISLVTFPSNDRANINPASVKSLDFSAFDMRDLETALREGGLSRADAKTAVVVFRNQLRRDVGEPDTEQRDAATSDELLARATRFRASLA